MNTNYSYPANTCPCCGYCWHCGRSAHHWQQPYVTTMTDKFVSSVPSVWHNPTTSTPPADDLTGVPATVSTDDGGPTRT